MSSSSGCDVAVVGGGVIGLVVAWRAARRGLRVTVLDAGPLDGRAWNVAAGMIAPVVEAELGEGTPPGMIELTRCSAAGYPAFVDELREASGRDPGFNACGTLVLARDRDEA